MFYLVLPLFFFGGIHFDCEIFGLEKIINGDSFLAVIFFFFQNPNPGGQWHKNEVES